MTIKTIGEELVQNLNAVEKTEKPKSNTYNRGTLKKEIIKGEWLVRRKYRYTDDYAWDSASDFGKTGFMEAKYFPDFWLWLEEKGLVEEFNSRLNEVKQWEDRDSVRREYTNKYAEEKNVVEVKGMVFDQNNFKNYGHAWKEVDGSVVLYFGYTSFEFIRTNKK